MLVSLGFRTFWGLRVLGTFRPRSEVWSVWLQVCIGVDVKVLHTYVEVLGLGSLRLRGFGPKSLTLRLNPKPFSCRGNLQVLESGA